MKFNFFERQKNGNRKKKPCLSWEEGDRAKAKTEIFQKATPTYHIKKQNSPKIYCRLNSGNGWP
ncbi:MAG: hypothetical protein IH886_04055 [Nitrospinae bacterium]|nr:hypothetical protein [Nitrospinota bacterium]